jgi:hypothetical protein
MGDRSVYCVAGLRLTIKERDTAKDEESRDSVTRKARINTRVKDGEGIDRVKGCTMEKAFKMHRSVI